MAAIITNKFRIFNAATFKEQFLSSDTTQNLYLFIGKPDAWDDDTIPDPTIDTTLEDVRRWYDMIALKKIIDVGVSHAIPRYDWDSEGNTKYVAYHDDDVDFYNHPTQAEISAAISDGTYTAGSVYVMTDEFNIYLCLSNNGNAKSTIKPTGRSTSVFETADGYQWKYIYTVSQADALKYVTPEWIPVKTLTEDDGSNQWSVQAAAVDGSLEIINVTAGGSGYTNVLTTATLVAGAAQGGTLPVGASAVDDVYNGCTVFLTGGTGSGQSYVITDYNGTTKEFSIAPSTFSPVPDGTTVVDVLPTVQIAGDGTGAAAKATVSAGAITKISVTTRGSGYRTATATIVGGGGTGATAYPVITPIGGHGKDAVKELGGSFIALNVQLAYDESDFITSNDYRRFGIVANVRNESDDAISTATTLSALRSLSLTSVTGTFLEDEEIVSDGAGSPTALVVEYAAGGGSTGTIRFFQNSSTGFGELQTTEVVTGQTSGAVGTISANNDPEVKKFSGDILYAQNRRPIVRSTDQIESITIILEY